MIPAETLAVLRFVKAACPQQKIDEYTPDAWQELLSDIDYAAAKEATRAIARTQPFVSPSEIRSHVRRARADRLQRQFEPAPDADPDDVPGYLRALREGRHAVAGELTPRPELGKMIDAAIKTVPALPVQR